LKANAALSLLQKKQIFILLFLGLIVGLTYVFVVPPWMHYDEPGHFEYAWLIANRDEFPEVGDYDQYMRREVAASMMEHHFDEYTGVSTSITSITDPVNLLIPQVGDPPLYYFLVSLPLRLVKHTDIAFQLYLSRMVSLLLFLVTVLISWQIARALSGPEHPMNWILPGFLIAIPGFVDLMTAVNNDALAILSFSLFIWASTLLLMRGFSFWRLVLLLFSVALCFFSKNTAWLAIPLSLPVLSFSIFRGKRQKFVWIGLAIILITAGLLAIDWGKTTPIHYSTAEGQNNLVRVTDPKAPSGQYILRHTGKQFHQTITQENQIAGKLVTFSAYIWADQETEIKFPVIGRLDAKTIVISEEKIQVTTEPTLHKAIIEMPAGNYIAWLTMFGASDTPVYWDEITLTTKSSSTILEPGENEYINVIKNSSIESGFPKLSDRVDWLLAKTGLHISASQIVELFDYNSSGWYLNTTAFMFFRTFWGYFGWGAVPLLGTYAYEGLKILTILCSLTTIFFIVKNFRSIPKTIFFLFAVILLLQLFMVFARGAGSWYSRRYYPPSRYFYPVIIPVILFFSYGIYRLLGSIRLGTKPGKGQKVSTWRVKGLVFLAFIFFMIIWGIISINSYYF